MIPEAKNQVVPGNRFRESAPKSQDGTGLPKGPSLTGWFPVPSLIGESLRGTGWRDSETAPQPDPSRPGIGASPKTHCGGLIWFRLARSPEPHLDGGMSLSSPRWQEGAFTCHRRVDSPSRLAAFGCVRAGAKNPEAVTRKALTSFRALTGGTHDA